MVNGNASPSIETSVCVCVKPRINKEYSLNGPKEAGQHMYTYIIGADPYLIIYFPRRSCVRFSAQIDVVCGAKSVEK